MINKKKVIGTIDKQKENCSAITTKIRERVTWTIWHVVVVWVGSVVEVVVVVVGSGAAEEPWIYLLEMEGEEEEELLRGRSSYLWQMLVIC